MTGQFNVHERYLNWIALQTIIRSALLVTSCVAATSVDTHSHRLPRDNQRDWQHQMKLKSTSANTVLIPVWEQLATDQPDPRQVFPRQIFTPYDCLLFSVKFVVLCCVGCLWLTGVELCRSNLSRYWRSRWSHFLWFKESFWCRWSWITTSKIIHL